MKKTLSKLSSTFQEVLKGGILLLALIASTSAIYASDTQVDSIWYDFNSSTLTASVTYQGSTSNSYNGEYSGSVIIPETVTYNGATYSVTSIGSNAFLRCYSLTSVTIPNSVTSIGSSAFSGCSSLTKTNYAGDIAGWCDIKFGNSSANPIYYSHNFYINDVEIKDLVIPNSVDSIHNYAFYGCSSLTFVTIPNSVTSIGRSAFSGCSGLTSLTIPNSVTSIGSSAFFRCPKLTSVTINSDAIVNKDYSSSANISHIFGSQVTKYIIGDKVKGIGEYAFKDCSSLTSMTIPNSVTSIGNDAFSCCSKLTSVTIPNSVTSIGSSAFSGCSGLTSLTIPNSVTSIGNYAFNGCSGLTSVTIPNSVTSIGNYTFYACSGLTSLTIPNSVTSIGSSAFSGCSGLTSLTIPNSVTSIGNYAFNGCSELTKTNYAGDIAGWCDIKFGNSSSNPIYYSHNFYINDVEIRDLVIPNSVDSIHNYAFSGCSALSSITCEAATPPTIGSSAFNGVSISIPVYVPCGCVEAYEAKSGWKNFTNIQEQLAEYSLEVDVNDSIMGTAKVEYNTFCKSNRISATPNLGYHFVQWSDGNTENPRTLELTQDTILIAEFAQSFSGQCGENLYWELIETTLHITGSGEMYNYTSDTAPWKLLVSSIKVLTIAEDVTSIGEFAFSGCSFLTSVTIPNSVTSIGNSAFEGCSSLTSVTISNSVTSIGFAAFAFCSSLTSVTIPNSVTSIGDLAFYGCSSLTSVTIPNSVTSIGIGAFQDCTSLTSITIPNSVRSIGDQAFDNCSGLTSITIPESVTSIGESTFSRCSSLTSVTIGDSVTSIGIGVFRDCTSLTSITIPNSVRSIGDVAFSGCSSLTSVTIPNSVTSIGESTFSRCSSLTSITCEAATPPTIGSSAFNGVSKSIPVYVPCGCVEAYKAKSGWSDFTNIQVPLAEYSIEVYVNDTIMGTAKVNYNTFCEGARISATPNLGYHFVQWSDGNTENPRTLELTQDTILIAEFAQSFSGQCGENLYWELIETTLHITGSGEMYNYTSDTAPWKLLVSSIKVLTIAEDVTSIQRSAFSGCPALESVVWNAKNYANPTNKETAPFYDIRSQIKSFTFGDKVEYIPAYLCYGMEKLTSITTPNSLNTIGTSAFEGCARLAKISLGTGLEKIAANTFAGCNRLYDIYVYATYPPFADESSFANYKVYVYIPCEYQRGYTLDVVWGKFQFIECIESEDATTDGNVTVDPGFNDVTITWPKENNADNYTIVIEKDGKVFCTLTFNAAGQLLNIAFAPSRDGSSRPVQYAEQAVNGYRFTVTGLDEGSAYIYELVIKDNGDNVLQTYSGEFRTQSVDDRTVTVEYDALQGQVIGAGTYLLGDTATLTVIPNEGYQFVAWGDGCTDNPRNLVVTQDTTLTVVFEVLTYNVTVTCDPIQGSITGSGTYNHGDGVTLTAIPNEGYQFVRWSNDVVDNPYTFVISEDITLTAEFEEVIYNSVENTTANTSTAQKLLRDGQLLIIRAGKTYDAMGQEL